MTASSDWFASRGTAPAWAARIFCFPHAGGNARTFLDWQPGLGEEAEIVAVCAPGRDHQTSEPVPTIDELIEGATAAISAVTSDDAGPIYLFGHSLGALVAFEVARRLRDQPQLRHLVASGLSAPSMLPSPRVRELAKLDGKDFAEALGFFGGLPPEILAEEDLLDLLLPGLIADFRLAATYRYHSEPPLPVDVSLINGREDPHVGPAQLRDWERECRNPPSYHWSDGGHFYFEQSPSTVIDLLLSVVRADQHVELI
jgi:surfactin synthase thioesterase subunit